MKFSAIFIGLPILGSLIAGCGGQPGGADEEPLNVAEGAFTLDNSLVPNALVPNALVPNALVPNALAPSALNPAATLALQHPGTAGDLSRLFLKYAVGCAFDSGQSFEFSWTDDLNVIHNESFRGTLGLATGWASGPISQSEQEWVSACLAARTNYYGIPVMLSLRANGVIPDADSTELAGYSAEEGVFWGNLFGATPSLKSCYQATNVTNSRTKLRDCAAGHVDGLSTIECGNINIIGSCDDWCGPLSSIGQYRRECVADPAVSTTTTTGNVITVFLPPP